MVLNASVFMAKQKFTIAHDIRMGGKHIPNGSPIELDATETKDAMTLHNLLSSNRIKEVDTALKALADAQVKSSDVSAGVIQSVHPPVEPKAEKAEKKG